MKTSLLMVKQLEIVLKSQVMALVKSSWNDTYIPESLLSHVLNQEPNYSLVIVYHINVVVVISFKYISKLFSQLG